MLALIFRPCVNWKKKPETRNKCLISAECANTWNRHAFDHDRICIQPFLPLFLLSAAFSWANNSLEILKYRVRCRNMTCAILIQIVSNYGPTFTPRRCNAQCACLSFSSILHCFRNACKWIQNRIIKCFLWNWCVSLLYFSTHFTSTEKKNGVVLQLSGVCLVFIVWSILNAMYFAFFWWLCHKIGEMIN